MKKEMSQLKKVRLRHAIAISLMTGFIASLDVSVPASAQEKLSTEEMNKYLLIGTTSNDIAKAVNVQNGDLGADIVVLSDEIDDNVDFDLDDVFLNNAGKQWKNVDNKYNTNPDYLPGAARVGEGVTWTGDVGLTSPNAAFDMSNIELYGQVGVVAASSNPVSSVSNSEFFPNGVGDGFDKTGNGKNLPPNGVSTDTNAMAALRAELDAFESYVTDLAPEATLKPGKGLPTSEGIEDVDYFELNVDLYDTNNDGIAVIDIEVDNGNSDFKLTNSNWVIESEKGTRAIFRILGGSNLVLNQSTIVIGDGILGNKNASLPQEPTTELGAIFIKANDYNNGKGGRNDGEEIDSGDVTFNFNDTVLNGVGFYDLIIFDEQNKDAEFDNGTTELVINNGQGCTHFISPKINFNNVRFERCSLPEGESDADKDGVADDVDNCPAIANPGQENADGDEMGDACDPLTDTDGDGIANEVDNCPVIANSGQENADGDEMGDACDSDLDGDTIANDADNCPAMANKDQNDADGDKMGDACDSDLDGDSIANDADNCPAMANKDQNDADGDKMGDACDPLTDTDGDSIADDADNCPAIANKGQENADGDEMGDACDPLTDTDGDSIADDADNCPAIANPGQENADGDEMGDACDSDRDGDSIADEDDNCPTIANQDQQDTDEDGMGDACESGCDYIYGVHDGGKNNTQLLRYSVTGGIEELGTLLPGYDVEALDISPDNVLYGASGDDASNPGFLYTFDMATGAILTTKETNCTEIDGISFNSADKSLWGWDQTQGLITIVDGVCSSVLSNENRFEIEDLTWDNAGEAIYFVYNAHSNDKLDQGSDRKATYHLGKYVVSGGVDWNFCNLQASEIEAIEMLNDGNLLIGYHNHKNQQFTQLNVSNCELTNTSNKGSRYDIEGLTVCPPAQ